MPMARCVVALVPGLPRDLLAGLDEYSHAWVVYVFHANTNIAGTRNGGAVKGKVRVPRLNGGTIGALATRTPHRPLPIGLSVGRVLAVDLVRGELTLGGLDLVDGTPVLDVKPYLPFCDAVEGATAPHWVGREASGGDEPLKVSVVNVSPEVSAVLATAWLAAAARDGKSSASPLYTHASDFETLVCQVLSLDIRSTRCVLYPETVIPCCIACMAC